MVVGYVFSNRCYCEYFHQSDTTGFKVPLRIIWQDDKYFVIECKIDLLRESHLKDFEKVKNKSKWNEDFVLCSGIKVILKSHRSKFSAQEQKRVVEIAHGLGYLAICREGEDNGHAFRVYV